MPVPLFDIKKQTQALAAQLRPCFENALASGVFVNGPEVDAFETEFATYLKAPAGTLGLSSGTDALLVALMAIGAGPGDKILLPAFTFFATAGAVARVGAEPVFVDIDPVNFNVCPKDLRKKYSHECKAIIPVHLFGQSAPMDEIMAFAKEKNLIVIEDVAQAVGGCYKGQALGTLGDWGCYSFFPTKNMGAMGDAGALCAKNPNDLKKAKQLRNHGDVSRYEHIFVGGNFRIDALQAAFLRVKLPHLDKWVASRRANATYYQQALRNCDLFVLPSEAPGALHTFNQYTLRIKNGLRDAFKDHLSALGIGNQVYYPIPLHRQKCFEKNYCECPEADKACKEVLSIPIFPELTQAERSEVVVGISSFSAKA